jgi:uncharacterized protein (TIGR03083 family)
VDLVTATDTIAAAGRALTDAGRASPDAPIAACPGWTVSTVVKHVGLVHQWASGVLRDYPLEAPAFPKAPPDLARDGLPDWADVQRDALLAALAASDGDRQVWAFGAVQPARFWWRRQAVETAMHGWDASNAAGVAWAIPPDVGAEGIEELLEWNLARRFAGEAPTWGAGRTIHFHRTDGDGEWLLTIGDPPVVERGHAKGDLAVRGPAAELLLWAGNRKADVTLFGDLALADGWAANVKT